MSYTVTRKLWTTRGSDRLLSAKLVVQTAVPLDASHYWTDTLYRRRAATATTGAQATGETVGTYSNAARDIPADTAVTLYDDTQGLLLDDGDSLVWVATTTGTPSARDDPRLRLDIQRSTR